MSLFLPPLPPTFEAALRDVRARGEDARIAAGQRLGNPDPDRRAQALQGLISLASDKKPRVRQAALRALRVLEDDASRAVLVERLYDADPLARELATIAFGALSGPVVEDALTFALHSVYAEVRFQAVASYLEAVEEPSLSCLLPLLADIDAKVRARTARALSEFGDAASSALRNALSDGHPDVRTEAALALAQIGDAAGSALLRAALDNPDRVHEALDAIGSLQLREHADAIAVIANATLKPLVTKVAAARALLRLGDPRGVPALRQVLRAFRSTGRSYAVEVVGELRVHALTDELLRLSQRLRGTDPDTLATALQRLREGLA